MFHVCWKLFHMTIAESQCSRFVGHENFPIVVPGGKNGTSGAWQEKNRMIKPPAGPHVPL